MAEDNGYDLDAWYQSKLKRGPNDNERASDMENIGKYGASGFEADFQKRLGSGAPAGGDGFAGPAQGGGAGMTPGWHQGWMKTLVDQQAASAAQNKERGDSLFNTLIGRMNQSRDIDPSTNPAIRRQADVFSAGQERSKRDYLSDLAEGAGPYANLRGEKRLATERAGQASGQFEAGLVGKELQAIRDEIAGATSGAMGLVSGDQSRDLQREMGILDSGFRQAGLGLQGRGLDLQNKSLDQTNDLALRNLGLQDWDRQMYWDMIRSGAFQ